MISREVEITGQTVLSQLDWTLGPEDIKTQTEKLISYGKEKLDEIAEIPTEKRNFQTVVRRLDTLFNEFATRNSSLYFPAYCSTDSEVRNASSQATQQISKFFIDAGMREDIFQAVKDVKTLNEDLDTVDSRLLDRFLTNYRRNGLDLPEEKKTKLIEIKKELSKIAIEFSQVMNEIKDTVEFTKEELEGLPDNLLSNYKRSEDGKFIVGMSYPETIPVLEYAKNTETRRRLAFAYANRGVKEGNVDRFEKTIKLRDEARELMGYDNHANFVLEIKMAKNAETVISFLKDIQSKLKSVGEKDLEELIQLKNEELGEHSDGMINAEDYLYYKRLLIERKYTVDQEEIKQYFPMQITVENMLEFYQDLLGLKFQQLDAKTWHEDVMTYSVTDNESGDFIGVFYLDLFPREGKYNHAAAFTLIRGMLLNNGTYNHPVSVMECNFNKPTETTPSLLKHSQVVTLYHEFGHIMHQVCTKSRYSSFSGTSVARDFVEAPSQMLENWIWEPSVLKSITTHYVTGEPMPDDLIDRLVSTRYALSGLNNLRQIFFGTFDMVVHTSHFENGINSDQLWRKLRKEVSLIPALDGTNGVASFGHIIGGYDAGYYGYMWSKVLAQDMYTRFEKEGINSPVVGMDYRRLILETGNDRDENEIVEEFLGRKPNNEAFLKSLGL